LLIYKDKQESRKVIYRIIYAVILIFSNFIFYERVMLKLFFILYLFFYFFLLFSQYTQIEIFCDKF